MTLNHEYEVEDDAEELAGRIHGVIDDYGRHELEALGPSCERLALLLQQHSTARKAWESMSEDQYTTERDGFGRLLADREVWRQATTIPAAGELTARWLEGRSEYQPGTSAPGFDEETGPIAGQLAELNRNGLFTKESQPGVLAEGHAQRAYVTGYCTAETAAGLLQLSARTGLVTVAHAPGEPGQASIPVTVRDEAVVTVLGSSECPISPGQLDGWSAEANGTLALVLAESWYMEVFDPVWGRNGLLLPAVRETLTAE